MAIYHCSVKTISRSKGQNAIAAGAYRSGEMLVSEQTGEIFDYRRKLGVVHKEIILPDGFSQIKRNELWNLAESSEVRRNSTVAREYEIALPHELDESSRRDLARKFSEHLAATYEVAVDLAIHAPGRYGDGRNHHAHLLTTTRAMTPSGLGAKTRVLDDRKTGEIERIRERWAAMVNAALDRAGQETRVSHKSLKNQGSDRHPAIHLGPAAAAMERRGEPSERGEINRAVLGHNFHLDQAQKIEGRLQGLRRGLDGLPDEQSGLSGLIKKGLRKIANLWPGSGGAQPAPVDKDANVGHDVSELKVDAPENRKSIPQEPTMDRLAQAEKAAYCLESLLESARRSQADWGERLQEMEDCALAGRESEAREHLRWVQSQVKKHFPGLEITKIQEFASAQAEKVRDADSPTADESDLERAAKIDQTARRARYNLLVMRDHWSGKINKAGRLQQQEEKISARAKKISLDAGNNYEDARSLLVKLERTGQDLSQLLRDGVSDSSAESISALLLEVEKNLPQAVEKIEKCTEELQLPVGKLQALAADRGRLSEDARQAVGFAAQASEVVNQAEDILHDLAKKCQPLRAMLARLEEQREQKPEKSGTRSRPRGMER